MKKVLIGIIVLLICILCLVIFSYKRKVTFVIPEFDKTAISIPSDVDNKYYTKLDITEGLSIGVSGILLYNSKMETYVNLTSFETNTAYVKIRLLDKSNKIIGESGLIKPGEYIEKIKLNKKVNEKDKFTLKVMAYDPETYYSAASVKLSVSLKEFKDEK